MRPPASNCPVETTLQVIAGRWKMVILYHLFEDTQRFSSLRRAIPGVTQKMLTQQLRELERDGVVSRRVYAEVPPRVEYSLTPLGRSLEPVMTAMCRWGTRHRNRRAPVPARPPAAELKVAGRAS
jgi:DNA-binding HxlR family transcriptional regulator